MTDTVTATLPLQCWQGDRGTYRLVTITGAEADAIAEHALLQRLEFGRQRGFGSVKVMARIGETEWKTSVFPMKVSSQDDLATRSLQPEEEGFRRNASPGWPSTRSLPDTNPGGRAEGAGGMARANKHWTLLVSKKVMRAEDLSDGETLTVELSLL